MWNVCRSQMRMSRKSLRCTGICSRKSKFIVTYTSWCYTTHSGYVFYSPLSGLTSSCTRLLDHTQRRAAVSRTPLNEWSVRRRDFYLTTHNTHNRQTSMPQVGFFFCKMIHLLLSDLEIQTSMIKMHLACQNHHKKARSVLIAWADVYNLCIPCRIEGRWPRTEHLW